MDTNSFREWAVALKPEYEKPYFKELRKKIIEEYKNYTVYPPVDEVFTALKHTAPENVKVVIFGQDPYHEPGQAKGLCFAVNKGCAVPPSLKNIYKELKNEYPDFNIPSHGDISHWADQGVLLLNAVLTVRAHQARSHAGIGWEEFTSEIINIVEKQNRPIVYMLWGKDAKEKKSLITNPNRLILETTHPSPFSASYGFLGCGHFKKANDWLIANGETPIDWNIPE
jgi:uracil-DNA glycosylase